MRKYPLIGASIIVMVLIVLGSFNNIVGYQTVQASNQKIINSEVNPKELLFQTIVDMANNKELQRIILGSELTCKRSFDSNIRFSTFKFPVITEKFLKRAYTTGVILSKTFSKSKMRSLPQQYQVSNQEVQKRITAVIEKDVTLKAEMTQLSNLKCDCENQNTTRLWNFPVLCTVLLPLFILSFGALIRYHNGYFFEIMLTIGFVLNCYWYRAIVHP